MAVVGSQTTAQLEVYVATVVIVTGGSRGIGAAVCRHAPHRAHVVDISRSGGTAGTEHVPADLADPDSWNVVGSHVEDVLDSALELDRTVLVHAAGTLTPIGFAGEVDGGGYATNVLVNSAAGQVLGHRYLAAVHDRPGRHQLCMISSGAASSAYAGWSGYCAGKAALEHWVRTVGREQQQRGGVEVCAVAPGVVDTGMQAEIRSTSGTDFPAVDRFHDLHDEGALRDPDEVGRQLWGLLDDGVEPGAVLDLRRLD